MTRKTLLLLALVITVTAAGCKKKPTPTPVPPQQEDKGHAEVVTPLGAPIERPLPQIGGDPLGGELDEVNAYLQEKGLLGDVYFEFDEAQIKDEAASRLRKNAEFIRTHPQFVFTIEGHCDDRDTIEYNLALGQRRADATQSYLSDLQIGKDRLQTISYGKEKPVCNQSTDDCRSKNRRAHFVVAERRPVNASN